jgi:hypothetical protein
MARLPLTGAAPLREESFETIQASARSRLHLQSMIHNLKSKIHKGA